MTGSDAVLLGQYRGFSMVLAYDGRSNEYRMPKPNRKPKRRKNGDRTFAIALRGRYSPSLTVGKIKNCCKCTIYRLYGSLLLSFII